MFRIYRVNFSGIKPPFLKRLLYNMNFTGFKRNRLETQGKDRLSFSLSCIILKGLMQGDPEILMVFQLSRPHRDAQRCS